MADYLQYPEILRPLVRRCDEYHGVSYPYNRNHEGGQPFRPISWDGRDTLLLEVLYCGQTLRWEVQFLGDDFTFAPDFFFDDDFLEDPDINVIRDHVGSLMTWNVDDDLVLVRVLNEFLVLYRIHQRDNVINNPRAALFASAYRRIISNEWTTSNHIDMCIADGTVYFKAVVQMQLSSILSPSVIASYCTGEELSSDTNTNGAFIKISYIMNNKRYTQKVDYFGQLASVMRNVDMPKFTVHQCGGPEEFLERLQDSLKELLTALAQAQLVREQFVDAMYERFTVLEVTVTKELRMALYLQNNRDMSLLVLVVLSKDFPRTQPTITVRTNRDDSYDLQYHYRDKMSAAEIVHAIDEALKKLLCIICETES